MAKIGMYVSHICDIGGEQRVSALLANELVKKHEVVIFTQDTKEQQKENPFHLSKDIVMHEIIQPQFPFLNRTLRRLVRQLNEDTGLLYKNKLFFPLLEYAYFQKRWQDMLVETLNKEHFDVLLAVSGGNTIQIGLIADRLNCKTIGWEHNTFQAYFETKGKYFYHQQQLFLKSLKQLDECVVLNNRIKEDYREAFQKECRVIYNPRSFVSDKKSPLTEKMFVTLGRITKQKGYDLLIDSFAEFAKENDDWKLTIVGDGEDRGLIEEKIKSRQLENRICITGYQSNVRDYLLQASCYLMPSRWEGFPMVLTEAFEMGLPAIAYDIIAVEPLIENKKQGLLAKAFDTEDYARQMLEMANMEEEKRHQMAQNAIEKANELSIDKIVEQWEQLLQ